MSFIQLKKYLQLIYLIYQKSKSLLKKKIYIPKKTKKYSHNYRLVSSYTGRHFYTSSQQLNVSYWQLIVSCQQLIVSSMQQHRQRRGHTQTRHWETWNDLYLHSPGWTLPSSIWRCLSVRLFGDLQNSQPLSAAQATTTSRGKKRKVRAASHTSTTS